MTKAALALLALVAAAGSPLAQDAPRPPAAEAAPLPTVPSSPAFEALGVTPADLLRPTSVRDLAAQVAGFVDPAGKIKPAVAVEAAPLWLAFDRDTTLGEWRRDAALRARAGLTLSFATAPDKDAETVRMSEGLRFVLFDTTDPRWDRDLETCLIAAVSSPGPPAPPSSLTEAKARAIREIDSSAVAACKEKARAAPKAGTALAFAAALTQASQGGSAQRVRADAMHYWGTYAFDVGAKRCPTCQDAHGGWASVHLGAHLSRAFQANVNELSGAARIRFGTLDAGLALDAAWAPRWDAGTWKEKAGTLGAVVEVRVLESTWLAVHFGAKIGSDATGSRLFTNVSVNPAFGASRVVVPGD